MLNAETRALVAGLAHYRVETEVFDTWGMSHTGIRDILRGTFDAVYAVAGSQLVQGPDRWNLDFLELLPAPLLYRLADPPFASRYLAGLEALRHLATVSVRDHDCGDFLDRAGIRPPGVHYAPGRFDAAAMDGAGSERPLAERDIPFLYVGTVAGPEATEEYVRTLLPDRLPLLRDLSDAVLAEPTRPVWRVAEEVYDAYGDGLVPYFGPGRPLLYLANTHANARFRIALLDRLLPHDGVLVLGKDAPAAASGGAVGAKVLKGRDHAAVTELMRRSRVVVATPPYFSVGAVSERAYWAMAAGAVSLALRTPAMDRHFDAGRDFLGFGRDLDGLEAVLVTARERPQRLQAVADAGRQKVRREFADLHNVRLLFEPILDLGDPVMTGVRP